MSSFTTQPWFEPVPNSKFWIVRRGFTYHIGTKYSKNKVVIPFGFKTDFASVPRLLWGLIPPWGRYGKATIVHDYLYQNHQDTNLTLLKRMFSSERKKADTIFKEAMQVLAVKRWKVFVMYWGVRIGGWLSWKERYLFWLLGKESK